MLNEDKKEHALRSRLPEIVRELEIEQNRRITHVEIAEQTGLNVNTIGRWMSPEPFKRVESHSAIVLRQWAGVSYDELLEEVEIQS